jgi:hypothetical protein
MNLIKYLPNIIFKYCTAIGGKMRTNIFIYSAIFFLASSILTAQDSTPFQRPPLGPEQAKLAFLVGNFTTTTQVMPSPMAPNGGSGKGTTLMKWGLDSMFIMLDEESVNQVFGEYKGHGMLGYDKRTGKYILSMFNNFGDTPQYRGTFNGDTLTLMTNVEFPGGSFGQKLLWFKENNTVHLKIFNDVGKGFALSIEETSTPSTNTMK